MLRHDFSKNGQGAFDEKGIVVDHSMTGNDENDRRSSRPQMLSRLLRGDELPKDGASLVLAKLGTLDKDEEDEIIDADLTVPVHFPS